MNDHRCQRHKHICENVGSYNIVPLISDFILYFYIINDVTDHHIKGVILDLVRFFIVLYSRNSTRIQVCSHNMTGTKLKGCDSKNSASSSDIKDLRSVGHIFLELTDYQLCSLMHTGTKGCTRIDVKDHFVLVFFCDFFPGRNDQNIIYIKLMEKFLPVIDPVLVLCL